MNTKILTVLLALVVFSGLVTANVPTGSPDINITDGKNVQDINGTLLYPTSSDLIVTMQIADINSPPDANIVVGLTCDGNYFEISDTNSGTLCGNIGFADDNIACTYTIDASALTSLPDSDGSSMTFVDANCSLGVQVIDLTNTETQDANISGGIYADYNACDTRHAISDDEITLTQVCTGLSLDANGGTETVYYNKNRQRGCADNFDTYSDPFRLTFGEFEICYYATDGRGNTEVTNKFVHTASSDAYNLALLTEIALAAVILFLLVSAFLVRDLSPTLMLGLVTAAILMVIAILIFGLIL